jgi:PAS domain S-box-containing protein
VFSTQTYEWTASGIPSQLGKSLTHNVPHAGPMRNLFDTLERGEAYFHVASGFTPSAKSVIGPHADKSLLIVPIWVDGRLWGFLGVDDCHLERAWSDSEVASFGTVACMIGGAVARMRAERALIESEERFRLAFEYSAAGMALSDPSMKLLRVNVAYCQMVGYSAEELLELGVAGITHQDDLADERANFQAAYSGEKNAFSCDKRYLHKNGNVVWAHISAALLRDAQGEPSFIIAQIIDITERKRVEQALRLSEERFRHLAEGVADIIWTTDAKDRFTYCTPAVYNILGYTQDEILHQNRQKLMYQDEAEYTDVSLQQLLKKRQAYRDIEFRALHKDGREVVLESSADPVFDHSGAFAGFHGIDRDITVWKQAQAERERLIGELSRAVAEIETLHGLLPICSGCKKIRDDHDNWTAIESYISQRSDINFTHSLCPDCLRTLYPDLLNGANR